MGILAEVLNQIGAAPWSGRQLFFLAISVLLSTSAATAQTAFTRTYTFPDSLHMTCCSSVQFGLTSVINDTTVVGPVVQISNITVTGTVHVTSPDILNSAPFDWHVFIGSSPSTLNPGQTTGNPANFVSTALTQFHSAQSASASAGAVLKFQTLYDFGNNSFTANPSGQLVSASAVPMSLTNGLYIQVFGWSGAVNVDLTLSNIVVVVNGGSPVVYTISLVAGIKPPIGDGGPATSALLYHPNHLAIDQSGTLYIADQGLDPNLGRIRKVTLSGQITTIAGLNAYLAVPEGLPRPCGLATDGAGNLFVCAAWGPNEEGYTSDGLLKVDPAGTVSEIGPHREQYGVAGDGGPVNQAGFSAIISGLATDSSGNLYISDTDADRVGKITASTGIINGIAGIPATIADGFLPKPGYNGDGQAATAAKLSSPQGLAVDSAGNVYIADSGNNRVRKVSASGIITTVAGNGTAGSSGDGGLAATAQLNNPTDVAVDKAGNIYIADTGNNKVRKIAPDSTITTFAGTGKAGFGGDGGPASLARLNAPGALAVGNSGVVYIADTNNNRVRVVSSSTIRTVAGASYAQGDGGLARSAVLNRPDGVAIDRVGNLYIADTGNNLIRKVALDGHISTIVGTGNQGFDGDGGFAIAAELSNPTAVAIDTSGNLYIADSGNQRIRMAGKDGIITTVAGTGVAGYGGDGGLASSAQLNDPLDVAVDSAGNIYIADVLNQRVRKVTAGIITTVAGTGAVGHSGDGGPAVTAELNLPAAIAVDDLMNLYIADYGSGLVRRVDAGGNISTVVGRYFPQVTGGVVGYESGPAVGSYLYRSLGLQTDAGGNLYISDTFNNRIRMVNGQGLLSTIAGSGPSGEVGVDVSPPIAAVAPVITTAVVFGTGGYGGDDGPANLAQIQGPLAIAVDLGGNVFFADTGNYRIRRLAPPPPQIPIGGVSGAGLSLPQVQQISTNALINIFGKNFTPLGAQHLVTDADLVNGTLPTKLLGVCVQIGNQPAPILYVSEVQINVVVPALSSISGTVSVQVITNCGTPFSSASNTQMVVAQPASPEFFSFSTIQVVRTRSRPLTH